MFLTKIRNATFKKRKGVTLVELMIVILVLMVIAALGAWGIDWVQDSGRRSATATDMALIRDGLQVYQTHSKTGQPPENLGGLVQGLAANQAIDGRAKSNYVTKAEWTSDPTSFKDHWDNAYLYDKTNRTITSTNNGRDPIVVNF